MNPGTATELEISIWKSSERKEADKLFQQVLNGATPSEKAAALSSLKCRLSNIADFAQTQETAAALKKLRLIPSKTAFVKEIDGLTLNPFSDKPRSPDPQMPETAPLSLKESIQKTRKSPHGVLAGFEKKQKISAEVIAQLLDVGTLYVTPEKQGFYFDRKSRTLLAIDSDDFSRLLSDVTGLNPTEVEFNFLQEEIKTECSRRGTETNVYSLSHYDENKLFVSDFSGGMFILDGDTVRHAGNGEAGVLFIHSPLATSYKYLPPGERIDGANVAGFLAPVSFDPDSELTIEEAKSLLFVWMLSVFFPELHPTKLIPAFIGCQGSTKTTTARRFGILLTGARFNVGHLETAERGEQAFIATVCGKSFAAFDNADAPIKWLPDRLATFATGHEFELRELYTTNQLSIYKPTAHIVLTSRDPHFRRPDVAERLLILKLARPENFIPESEVIAELLKTRDSVWSDLLDTLNRTLNVLREAPDAPRTNFRMADFAAFGWRLSKGFGGDETAAGFLESLTKLEQAQASYTTEEDSTALCLGAWITEPANLGREIDTGSLFSALREIAAREGLILPKTSASLGKRLHQARKALELSLGVKIHAQRVSQTSYWQFKKPLGPKKSCENALPPLPALQKPTGNEVQEAQEAKKAESL